jgi:hypothetical protein
MAARWSGSVACLSPSRVATRRTTGEGGPSDSDAIQSSSPNMTLIRPVPTERFD